ncbi:MAG: hypothetical protein ABSB12_01705 [Candidatus Saccharimonadales bacterium]|jgi:hypothetical protein
MSDYPIGLVEQVASLPSEVDQTELNNKGLYVKLGLDNVLAEQLVITSEQADIKRYCIGDSTSRFHDLEQVTAWQAKGRLALPLVRYTGEGVLKLVGFGWMGHKIPTVEELVNQGAETTFAIRLYEGATGDHNSLPYTRAILQANDILYGNQGVWLETWGDNIYAQKTYERAGFQKVVEIPGERHGEKVSRVFMALGQLAI